MSIKSFAVLVCVYDGDSDKDFCAMLDSLYNSEVPNGFQMRLYLHLDGPINEHKRRAIGYYRPYKIIESNECIGLSEGLNKLIDARENERYFFRLDSDDINVRDRFVRQISFMEKSAEIDFSGGSISEFIGDTLNVVSVRLYPSRNDQIIDFMIKGSPFAHVTVCFRDSFFDTYGLYPTEYVLNEDIAYWYKSLSMGAIGANIEDNLVFVRMDNAYSRRTFKKAISEVKVYLKIARWQRKLPIIPLCRFMFRLFPSFLVKIIYNSKLRQSILK